MQVKILGCSGGIGAGRRTTSILIDDDILVDAGTGVGDLSLQQLRSIHHVFLTHAHLDHIAGLPLFIDAVFDSLVKEPLQIYGRKETLKALQEHIFNDTIWPDFSQLPSPEAPVICFNTVTPGDTLDVSGRRFQAIDVEHSVPTVGYCIESGGKVFAFSGDTMTNHTLWPVLNGYHQVDYLIIEVSFPDRLHALARASGHYCPRTLSEDLTNLEHEPEIWLTGMKPGDEDLIYDEVLTALPDHNIRRLLLGQEFQL